MILSWAGKEKKSASLGFCFWRQDNNAKRLRDISHYGNRKPNILHYWKAGCYLKIGSFFITIKNAETLIICLHWLTIFDQDFLKVYVLLQMSSSKLSTRKSTVKVWYSKIFYVILEKISFSFHNPLKSTLARQNPHYFNLLFFGIFSYTTFNLDWPKSDENQSQ